MRERLINAAVRVFSRNGFYKASMDDIAAEAEVAKGTLYYYFKNKSELFKTVVVEGINFLTDDLVKVVNNSDDLIENIIKALIKKNIDFYLEYYELTNIVLNEITNGIDEDVLSEIRNAKDRYINFLAGLLSEGYNQGIIRYSDFKMTAAGMIGMIDGVCKYYLRSVNHVDKERMIEYTSNMIIKGLFPWLFMIISVNLNHGLHFKILMH